MAVRETILKCPEEDKLVLGEYFNMLMIHSLFSKMTLPNRLFNIQGTLIDKVLCKHTECTLTQQMICL